MDRGRGARLSALMLVLSSCAPEPTRIEIPTLDGMSTVVVVTERSSGGADEVLRAVATSTAGPYPDSDVLLAPRDSESAAIRLTTLLYPESLRELDLGTGLLLPARLPEFGRPLPDPAATYQLALSAELSDWERVDRPSQSILDFRFVQ